MRSIIFLLLTSVFCLNSFAQGDKSEGEKSLKSLFEITIDGKKHIVSEDQILNIDEVLEKPDISVKLADYKKFNNGSLEFQIPNHYSLEYGEDFGYKNWTFSGNNFVVMYFEIDAKTTLDAFVDEMVKSFGKKNCKLEKVTKELGEQTLKGTRINISLAGQKLTLDFLEIVLEDYKTRFIAFQDSLDDNDNESQESKDSLEMISSSIEYE